MQREPDSKKNKKSWYHPKKIAEYDRKVDYLATGASWTLSGFERFIPAIDRIQNNLGFISLFVTVLGFPYHLYNLIYALAWSEENNLRRGTRGVIAVTGLIMATITMIAAVGLIVVAAPILMMVGAAKTLAESIWKAGLSFYERFVGQGSADAKEIKIIRDNLKKHWPPNDDQIARLTKLTNRQRRRNRRIANSLHVIAMNVVGIVAVGLLFSGVTSLAGTGILIGLSIYGAADAVGLNPIKRAGQLINWGWKKMTGNPLFSPFARKTENEIRADLYNEYTRKGFITPNVKIEQSEKQIMVGLQQNLAHHEPAPSPAAAPEQREAHPLSSLLSKNNLISTSNLNNTPAAQEDEGETEHPQRKKS